MLDRVLRKAMEKGGTFCRRLHREPPRARHRDGGGALRSCARRRWRRASRAVVSCQPAL